MASLFDYLTKYKNTSFAEEPITEIDRLILAELAYLSYEKLKIKSFIYLKNIANEIETLTIDIFEKKRHKTLFEEVINSKRFGMLEIGEVEAKTSDNVQFCAITFRVDSSYYIVFRGTDLSISGWREDLELGVYRKIPSYDYTLSYTIRLLDLYTGCFELIGHSKGGNIAFFIGSELIEKYSDKIVKITNFDGPGFNYDIFEKIRGAEHFNKFLKYIPKDDVVGLILDSCDNYNVVDSAYFGVIQHIMFFWQVEDSHLKRVDNISVLSKIYSKATIDWISSLSFEEKLKILKLFDEFFANAEVHNLNQLKEKIPQKMMKFIASYHGFSFEDKKMLIKLSVRMIKYYIDHSLTEIEGKIAKERKNLIEKR
ncbi:MAG: DUF2974 domain-containing protein [Erysipelotrichales bacterium]|nr:DUF2974 domain-containing protein [Erysipelotrichales bacterium]